MMRFLPQSPPDGGARTHTCSRRLVVYPYSYYEQEMEQIPHKDERRQVAPLMVNSGSIETSGCRDHPCCPCDRADHRALRWDGALNQNLRPVSKYRNFHHVCHSGDARRRLKHDQKRQGEAPHDTRSDEDRQCSRYRLDGRNAAARSWPCHPRCCRNRWPPSRGSLA